MRDQIFKKTKQQSLCPIWRNQRLGALTASILHRAARYKRDDEDNYVALEILGKAKFMGNIATDYGKKNEIVAKKIYVQSMKKKHQQFKVVNSGLLINRENPLLRASPDAVVSCHCCGKGLLEIKCPYSKNIRGMTAQEIARDGKYHLKIGGSNNVQLKHTSPWYTQVQAQLGVAQYSWCDFVIFTQKEPCISIERIAYDAAHFENESQRALNFHNRFVLPKLLNQ